MAASGSGSSGRIVAALSVSSPVPADMDGTVVQKTETPHYRLELDIGHPEQTYTAAQAATVRARPGEIMVSGP